MIISITRFDEGIANQILKVYAQLSFLLKDSLSGSCQDFSPR